MVADYTSRQGQYLAFIYHYTKIHGRPAAEADLQKYFGVSAPSIHQMILTLEKRRLIARTPGAPRSIRVLLPPERLAMLGSSPGGPETSQVPSEDVMVRRKGKATSSQVAKQGTIIRCHFRHLVIEGRPPGPQPRLDAPGVLHPDRGYDQIQSSRAVLQAKPRRQSSEVTL